jgi:hypothetical protein
VTVEVATRLVRPHPLVAATRRAAESAGLDDYGRVSVGPASGVARVAVSRPHLHRALLILHTLCREATRRGWGVVESTSSWSENRGIAIEIGGHRYALRIFELSTKIPIDEKEREAWRRANPSRLSWQDAPKHRFELTGRLKLSIPHPADGTRGNWTDGPRGAIESKFDRIFTELERRKVADDEAARLRVIEEAERERRMAEERERALLARRERERGERLQGQAATWARTRDVRDFVAELRRRLPELEAIERTRIAEWCEWADAWAEMNDPVRHPERLITLDDDSEGMSAHF